MKIEYLVLKDSTVKQYKIAINVNLVLFYYFKKITTNNWNLGGLSANITNQMFNIHPPCRSVINIYWK